jgi:hypothetical protein
MFRVQEYHDAERMGHGPSFEIVAQNSPFLVGQPYSSQP